MSVYVIHSKVNANHTDQLYFVLQPAQLLKGDIMVSGNREVDFLPSQKYLIKSMHRYEWKDI